MKNLISIILLIIFLITLIFSLSGCSVSNNEVYNVHEHIESFAEGEKMFLAMERAGIDKTILVGSPESTVLAGKTGFNGYEKNNKAILKLVETYPDKFIAFCTLVPRKGELDVLKDCLARGGKGLKLYSGHYAQFYNDLGPLTRSEMDPVYEYCEENGVPINFHINPGKGDLLTEFEYLLSRYPNLIVNCPHFCLSSINQTRFRYLMDKYPTLYTDVSFGFYVEAGLKRISKDQEKFRELIEDYQDRIMFGTDMVVTSHPRKTIEWVYNLTKCYQDMLTEERYSCNVGDELNGNFKGLNLDQDILRKIYSENTKKYLGVS